MEPILTEDFPSDTPEHGVLRMITVELLPLLFYDS